jgi:hypothetical protein
MPRLNRSTRPTALLSGRSNASLAIVTLVAKLNTVLSSGVVLGRISFPGFGGISSLPTFRASWQHTMLIHRYFKLVHPLPNVRRLAMPRVRTLRLSLVGRLLSGGLSASSDKCILFLF